MLLITLLEDISHFVINIVMLLYASLKHLQIKLYAMSLSYTAFKIFKYNRNLIISDIFEIFGILSKWLETRLELVVFGDLCLGGKNWTFFSLYIFPHFSAEIKDRRNYSISDKLLKTS